MPIENDINSFKMWASKMGCPINVVPTDEALNSLFRSRQSSLLFNIMERVRPKDEVETIRKNIFISRMKKVSGKTEKYERGFGPREYQRYCEIQDLESEKRSLEFKIKEVQEKCNMDLLKSKILQKEKLQSTLEDLEIRYNILDLKCEDLDTKIAAEEKLKEKIIKLIPAKLTSLNMNEENALKAITEALSQLDDFYNICLTSSNSHYIEGAKEKLWSKLRNIFLKIPNSSLWNVLMRMKEEQLQKIKDLNNIENKENQKFTDYDDISDFDLHLIKAKSSVLSLVGNYLAIKREENIWNEKFSSNYDKFCNEIKFKISAFGTEDLDDEDEVLSDYLVQYNTYSYNKGQKNFLVSEIERCKKLVEENNRALEDHEILLSSLKQMYTEIELNVRRTQSEVGQLNEIKDKIQYSKILMQHLISDFQSNRNQIANKTKTNLSGENSTLNITMSIDTLKLTPPGPGLCSTKLDMDVTSTTFAGNTTFRGNNSMMVNQNYGLNNILPQYTNELVLFKDIPIIKFKIIPKECQFTILKKSILDELPDPTNLMQHCSMFLLRPEIALLKFKAKFEWYNKLQYFYTNIQIDFNLPEINEANIKDKLNDRNEEIMQLIDEIKEIGINSERLLTKSQKYYDFLKENPLKQFIPPSKLVNNQTYADYDAEYNMYYRMITSSNNR